VKRINAQDDGAQAELLRWVYASGQVNSALQARRESELNQFEATA
jgi:GH24 family phage-related lysozyme (muramidase)